MRDAAPTGTIVAIKKKAIQILKKNAEVMRYTELRDAIHKENPVVGFPAITAAIYGLDRKEVDRPARGLFRHIGFRETQIGTEDEGEAVSPGIAEKKFYQAFADYLTNELEECSDARPLGGRIFGDRWGTPDVIGTEKSKKFDILQQDTVIVTAELKIKTDPAALIAAFG